MTTTFQERVTGQTTKARKPSPPTPLPHGRGGPGLCRNARDRGGCGPAGGGGGDGRGQADAEQRQRLTQLRVAYGNALLAARGFGAPETTEAFARARKSASGDKDAPERLAADYGLWVDSSTRGELP